MQNALRLCDRTAVRKLTRMWAALLLAASLALSAYAARADEFPYTEVFYPSGKLRIQAYLYKPKGKGPFPLVLYNHGSRAGRERRLAPLEFIGKLLAQAGYAALVVERRGYGKSDGPIHALGDKSQAVPQLQLETDDVLAAIDYLRTLPFVDMKRLGIMGHSYGGIVTMFATSRSNAFVVAINQAGGALSWHGNPQVRRALTDAAEKSNTPTLFQVAQNDRTTDSITTLAKIFEKRGLAHRQVIYPPFTSEDARAIAPGHMVFGAKGVEVWEQDVLEFLGRYLRAKSGGMPDSGVANR